MENPGWASPTWQYYFIASGVNRNGKKEKNTLTTDKTATCSAKAD